jgi:hypothetical protein
VESSSARSKSGRAAASSPASTATKPSEKQALQLLFIGQTSVTWTRPHALAEPIE